MKKALLVLVLLSGFRTAQAGCTNAGGDRRILAKIVCPLQNALSFRTFRKPVGIKIGGYFFVGFPPVVAFNVPLGGKFLHARALYRWDAHPATEPEKGCWEIFPSVSAKILDHRTAFWLDDCVKPTIATLEHQ